MEIVIFPEIFDKKVKAFFTGRKPGADLGRISEIVSIGKERIYMPIQKHTDRVLPLDSFEPKISDAVITDKKGVLIGVQGADCVPIVLYDRRTAATGVVHAGWRGTSAGILRKTIRAMGERFASSPSDLLIAIGPAIRWCCYGVGPEVVGAIRKSTGEGDYYLSRGEKDFLDLPNANRYQAISVGVNPENLWISEDCTYCLPERYYSYRFAKGPTGRQGGFIGIVG